METNSLNQAVYGSNPYMQHIQPPQKKKKKKNIPVFIPTFQPTEHKTITSHAGNVVMHQKFIKYSDNLIG